MSEIDLSNTVSRMAAGMPEDAVPTVSPEIAAMLEAGGAKSEPPKSGVLHLGAEAEAELTGRDQEGPRVDVPVPAQWQVGDDAPEAAWSLWTKDLGTLAKVEVTDIERKLFIKAAMNDTEVVFDIELSGLPEFPVKVRSLSNKMLRGLAMAMGKDGEDKLFRDMSIWASRLQYYCVLLQFAGAGDTVSSYLPAEIGGKSLAAVTIEELCDWLRSGIDDILAPVGGPRYLVIVQVIRVFEAKLSRCKEGLINGDFFDTAGTSS